MADTKISALPASTTPLAGTETLPIVQGGITKKVSVANLTSGRSVASAGGTFSDNFVQCAAAKGVNFTANTAASGMTSQLLKWYEEGTWTPTDQSGAGLTITVDHAYYTRIGRLVTVNVYVTYPSTSDSSNAKLSLPFVCSNYDIGMASSTNGAAHSAITIGAAASCSFRNLSVVSLTNADLSGAQILFTVSYTV